jgi:hypothetical protein
LKIADKSGWRRKITNKTGWRRKIANRTGFEISELQLPTEFLFSKASNGL